MMVPIVIGPTIKGLASGVLIGWYATRVRSVVKGMLVGVAIAAVQSFLVALQPQPDGDHHRVEIMLPGSIVGLIVGYATQQSGRVRT